MSLDLHLMCEHEFPPAEYDGDGKMVRKSYACLKCGSPPTMTWFTEQRRLREGNPKVEFKSLQVRVR